MRGACVPGASLVGASKLPSIPCRIQAMAAYPCQKVQHGPCCGCCFKSNSQGEQSIRDGSCSSAGDYIGVPNMGKTAVPSPPCSWILPCLPPLLSEPACVSPPALSQGLLWVPTPACCITAADPCCFSLARCILQAVRAGFE